MPDPLRIGLAGLGTVGAGVVRILQAHGATIAARAGRPVEIAAVSARSRHRDRGVDLAAYAWEDDPVALARRADVDLVVEVVGGENGPAKATADGGARGRQAPRHREQGDARPARAGAGRARRGERRRAALRGGGRRGHPGRQDADRRPRRQRDHPRHGGDERHLQLHPDPDGGGGRPLRRGARGGEAPRLRRGRSLVRRRRHRRGPEARAPRRRRLRHPDRLRRHDGRGHRARQPRRHRARGRARLPDQAARRRPDDRGRTRVPDAALPGPGGVAARPARGRHQHGRARGRLRRPHRHVRPRRRRRGRPPRRSSATSSTSRAAW